MIAGIFGAEFAEVSAGTTRVLLEAATFDGPNIIRTSLGLGLRTESSARFEKGQPRDLPPIAMAIACRLLHELAGAGLVPGVLDAHEPAPAPAPIVLRHHRVGDILGADIGCDEGADILERLGCTVDRGPDAHAVVVPWYRTADLVREIDLIEEVGRIHGFDRIQAVLPRVPARARLTPQQSIVRQLARRAADLGLSEAILYRFVPEADLDRLNVPPDDLVRNVVRISNALSDEMAVMRRSLLPGLLRAVERNQSHQRRDGGIFEVGRTYMTGADGNALGVSTIAEAVGRWLTRSPTSSRPPPFSPAATPDARKPDGAVTPGPSTCVRPSGAPIQSARSTGAQSVSGAPRSRGGRP